MRQRGNLDVQKRPKTAPGITRFPSADLWEDPWERNFDLYALRGRKERLRKAHAFAAELKPDLSLRIPDASVIEALVTDLDIGAEETEQLAEDIELLALWYTLPELGRQIGIGRETMLDRLRQAGQYADSLHTLLGGIAPQVAHLAEGLNLALPKGSHGDSLVSFADDVGQFGHVARDILKHMRSRGRPAEARRNHAIVLVSQAVEEASGEKIARGRDTRDRDGEHLTNASGRFVARVIRLLARSSERVVAGRFEELRAVPDKTSA